MHHPTQRRCSNTACKQHGCRSQIMDSPHKRFAQQAALQYALQHHGCWSKGMLASLTQLLS